MTNNGTPRFHTTDDGMVTYDMDDAVAEITDCIRDTNDHTDEASLDIATSLIMDVSESLTRDDVDNIMNAAYAVDPSLSRVGAEIRDTIRDNTEFDV
jgi:hypothetical protein